MKLQDLLAFAERHPTFDHLVIDTGDEIVEVDAFDVDVFEPGGPRCLVIVAGDDVD